MKGETPAIIIIIIIIIRQQQQGNLYSVSLLFIALGAPFAVARNLFHSLIILHAREKYCFSFVVF